VAFQVLGRMGDVSVMRRPKGLSFIKQTLALLRISDEPCSSLDGRESAVMKRWYKTRKLSKRDIVRGSCLSTSIFAVRYTEILERFTVAHPALKVNFPCG